ncbi:MAG: hypothetical protein JWL90_1657 [Chthoniobacteraceae bacterium]|jgi:hypothetical protein|nr:hypothetical protein [Chthoniobacteraceae bacterium]MDB6174634.1 hypothetical protein [Chthoniobacteraceae bacterium]
MIPSNAAIAEYEEQVTSFLRRASSKAEGVAALNQHSNALLKDLRALLPAIKESPAYAGVAFYGRFQAVNLSLIKKLAADNVAAVAALEAIRTGKALRVAASAKVGWDLLFKENPGALWAAIYLNLCVKAASVRVAAVREDDDEVDEDQDNDDQLEDDDDAN